MRSRLRPRQIAETVENAILRQDVLSAAIVINRCFQRRNVRARLEKRQARRYVYLPIPLTAFSTLWR